MTMAGYIMLITTISLVIIFPEAHKHDAAVKFNITSTITTGEISNGTCIVYNMHMSSGVCSNMRIAIMNNVHTSVCTVSMATTKVQLDSGCESDFTVACSQSNISINLICLLSHHRGVKKINVIPKPEIVTKPITAAVDRIGLPITLTCTVSGDPNHYWVGWMYRNSIIQRSGEHSLSASRSFLPNGTTHHLTVHYIKAPGNYTCQVYSIEGKQLDNVTHQVSVKENATESSTSLIDNLLKWFFK